MVLQENKIFCLAEQFGINQWILHKNIREQNGLTRSIVHKNKKQQKGISHWILKKKKNFFLAEQNGIKHWILQTKIRLYHSKEAHRNSAQHDLDHKITAFQTKIRECPYYICSVCNKTLYSKTVIQLEETNAQHSARTIFLTLHHLMKISTFVKPVTQKFWKGKSLVKLDVTNYMLMNCHQSCPF